MPSVPAAMIAFGTKAKKIDLQKGKSLRTINFARTFKKTSDAAGTDGVPTGRTEPTF